ncbi:MAG TPA: RNA 2',3'-cyclic phosphodiesterase [bacterium]|nr:RNA 2',3'-cyclic phosphodiesterase [bacterium]
MESVRLFAAIDLAPELQQKCAFLLEALSAIPSEVRWVPPANLHLTLRFFGEMSGEKEPLVCDLLAKAAARHGPFTLGLDGWGAFPSARNPRVLFVGLEAGKEPLRALAEDIEKSAKVFNLGPVEGNFNAHVTLGRVKSPGGLERVLEKLTALTPAPLGEMTVGSFCLYQSRLGAGAPLYTRRREFFLTK